MKILTLLWMLMVWFVISSQSLIFACSCGGRPSVCQATDSAELIVAGKVVRIEPVKELRRDEGVSIPGGNKSVWTTDGWKVYFQVDKTFKGNPVQEIVVSDESSSCSQYFKVGQQWLLYANFDKETNTWVAPQCGRSTQFNSVPRDSSYLENIAEKKDKTYLSGSINRFEKNIGEGIRFVQTFEGLRIKVVGKTQTFETLTDKNGYYELSNIPPDRYRVIPEVPQNLKVSNHFNYGGSYILEIEGGIPNTTLVDLRKQKCQGLDFTYSTNNEIRGKLFDAGGNPLIGATVQLFSVTGDNSRSFNFSSDTQKDGSYVLSEMPAGEYLLIVNKYGIVSSSTPFSEILYYPNTFDKQKAAIIKMGEGDFRKDYDIRVPTQFETITIKGRLTFDDGTPAANELIVFKTENNKPGYYTNSETKTDDEGRFNISILKGNKGTLYGKIDSMLYKLRYENCPQLDEIFKGKGLFDSPEVITFPKDFSATENVDEVELKFSLKGCKRYQRTPVKITAN